MQLERLLKHRGAASARRQGLVSGEDTLLAFSVDVEEYFQCEAFAGAIHPDAWGRYETRAEPFVERIAELLAATGNRATFFVLGWMVKRLGGLLRALAAQGHEIASHGQGHQHLRRMTPSALREDLRAARCALEDTVGVRAAGYRAPTFSVTRETAWALDVIAEAGFSYDSSIFPIRHDRYGVPDAPAGPFCVISPDGQELVEFPPLTRRVGRWRLPVGGGGYFRLLPLWVLGGALRQAERFREAALVYVHPWELDAEQPRLPAGRLATWRHRVNLSQTDAKLERLLTSHRFTTVASVLTRLRDQEVLPRFALRRSLLADAR